jgi:EpsI family protein
MGPWTAAGDVPLDDDIVRVLGVDDYVSRTYLNASGDPANLYIGYYNSQRQGDTIHSPQNCLPGAGWQPVSSERVTITAADRPLTVNRYVVQKGMDRRIVMYWYQGRGRVIADEYVNKLMLMVDAARLRRTNGGLVRLIAPATSANDSAEEIRFIRALFPHLSPHLP